MLKEMVKKVKTSGAKVLFCQKGVDDMTQHLMAKAGIIAARRVKKSDMEKLAKATGGRIITKLDDLKRQDLGNAGLVEERKVGEDKMIFVEGCKNPRSVAILLRAGLDRMLDEAERALHDALSVVADVIEHNKIVAGGGAVESEIARGLRNYAKKIGGREQLAIEAFANSIEIVPKTLAENAGLEPIDILVALRAAHEKTKGYLMGVDVFTGKIVDMQGKGVIEPSRVKEQAVKSATEAASMIIRIDDVIASTKPREGKYGPGAGPGAGM
jgi:chaperonin GroEL (HSP60 family)